MSGDYERRCTEAQVQIERTAEAWDNRHSRLVELFSGEIDQPPPSEAVLDQLRFEAIGAYEAMLDAMKVAGDLIRERRVGYALKQLHSRNNRRPPAEPLDPA